MTAGRLEGIGRMVRGQDWWFYKIPPLLAVAYATAIVCSPVSNAALLTIGATLLAICAVASYGYVINDILAVAPPVGLVRLEEVPRSSVFFGRSSINSFWSSETRWDKTNSFTPAFWATSPASSGVE